MTSSDSLPDAWRPVLDANAERLGCFAERVRYVPETPSTNDAVLDLALAGAPEGTALVAGRQTAGRGRRGRAWFSPSGAGLYVSVVFRPPAISPLLTLMSGVALAEAVYGVSGVAVTLKWPNDLVVERGTRRKLGGILAEAGGSTGGAAHVVVGFGINVAEIPRPASLGDAVTSIEAEAGHAVPLPTLLVECLASLAVWRAALAAGRTDAILKRWRQLSPSSEGSPVELADDARPRPGITAGIDADGALRVRVGDAVERVIAGDVRWN